MRSEADGNRKKRQLQIASEVLGMKLFEECARGMKSERERKRERVLGVMGIISIDPGSPPIPSDTHLTKRPSALTFSPPPIFG